MKNRREGKILISLAILLCIHLTMYFESSALSEQIFIHIKINDRMIKVDTQPYMKNDRTFVTIRFVAEALGADVQWVAEEKKVIIVQGGKTIKMFPGSSNFYVNGEKKKMDTVVEITNSRTMVPLRFIAENLGCSVEWDTPTYSVVIYKDDAYVRPEYTYERAYTDEDIRWLAKIIHVEGKGLSVDGKVAIANVILNRKKSPDYPDSVYGVIFDTKYCVQFPPAHRDDFKTLIPSKQCTIAAKMALEGINNVDKCLFFNSVPFTGKSDSLYKRIDGQYFYY